MGRAWLVAVVCVASAARAGGTLPGGATITFGGLYLHEGGNPQLAPAQDPAGYFNLAHCACSQLGAAGSDFVERTFAYELTLTGSAVQRPLELWVGSACDDATARAAGCHRVTTIADMSTLAGGGMPELGVYDVMEPEPVAPVCDFRAIVSGEWAIADGNGDGVYDYFNGQPVAVDALAPPLPTDFAVTTTPTTITIDWTPPADLSDIVGYQVLCGTASTGGPSSLDPPPAAPRYVTARALCGLSYDVPLHPSPIDPLAAIDIAIPQGIAQLDPSFICADLPDPTTTEVKLTHLQKAEPNVVLLVAVDAAGNAAATYFTSYLTMSKPSPAGCCNASGGASSCLLAALVLIWGRFRLYQRARRLRLMNSRT